MMRIRRIVGFVLVASDLEDPSRFFVVHVPFVGFLRVGCSRGGGNWGTLKILAGKIGEP